jgi:dTDP-3-amino-2,3,6-trideoxy-4-keto-D-glucose/dTDP-3-amino-3,4,6-trideoxy-alpha-D-glucose/dTDP-2,6-dideoxy-D-kanosamine transaminase
VNYTTGVTQASLVPLNDLKRQTERLGPALEARVIEVVRSGRYVLGQNVLAFETEFADYCGARHCVSVGNGTDALELSLRALDCGPGDEIITVANAGMYASAAILAVGARPVLADIDPESMTLAAASLERCIGLRTRVVIVTHLYGQLADMDALVGIASRHELPVVEDCAQSHGARRNGRCAGTFGAMGTFSFYPTKNLGALGDGGAVLTNDERLAASLRSLRQYGWRTKYRADSPHGRNSRLDEVQAAVLRLKLPYLDTWNARRRDIISQYRNATSTAVCIPNASGPDHVGHLCIARSTRRAALQDALKQDGIATDIHYPVPDHKQEALRGIIPDTVCLPVTEDLAAEILTLPCFPEMSEKEVARVCRSLAGFAMRGQVA